MRKFTEKDFIKIIDDNGPSFVSEASTLGFPPGSVMRQFEVQGFGVFTLVKVVSGESFEYKNESGVIISIFND